MLLLAAAWSMTGCHHCGPMEPEPTSEVIRVMPEVFEATLSEEGELDAIACEELCDGLQMSLDGCRELGPTKDGEDIRVRCEGMTQPVCL